MVLPIDEPSDQLYRLITHELTHIFEFDIIPRGIIGVVAAALDGRRSGRLHGRLLEHARPDAGARRGPHRQRAEDEPLRDASRCRAACPTRWATRRSSSSKSRWGKEGLRQFLFSLRKSVIGGGESAYEEALKLKPEDFDEQFDRYLKERFKPFRDKERPADYGRNLAPSPERTHVRVGRCRSSRRRPATCSPPSSATGSDQELDIVLISAQRRPGHPQPDQGLRQGSRVRVHRDGRRAARQPRALDCVVAGRATASRTSRGPRRTRRSIIQNVVTGKMEKRYRAEERRRPGVAGVQPGRQARRVRRAPGRASPTSIRSTSRRGDVTNLTKDTIADYAPTFSPDGKTIVYTARVSGNDKLFQLDLATGTKKQLTFGTHDDTGAKFYDDHTIVFTSTATDPTVHDAAGGRAEREHPERLDARSDDERAAPVDRRGDGQRLAGRAAQSGALQGRVRLVLQGRERHPRDHGRQADRDGRVASDFGAPGPIIDFTPPISHTLRARQHPQEGHVREDDARGPAAGQPRRHERRQLLRQHADHVHRRARRQADQLLRPVGLAVPHDGVHVREHRAAACSTRCRASRRISSTTGRTTAAPLRSRRSRRTSRATSPKPCRASAAARPSPSTRSTGTRASSCSAATCTCRALHEPGRCRQLAEQYQIDQYGSADLPQRPHAAARRVVRAGNDGVPRVRPGGRQHVQGRRTTRRPAFGNSWLSRQTLDVDARHYMRLVANGVLAAAVQGPEELGHATRTSSTSAATPRCAATSTSSSSGRRHSSPTPNCASR